MKITYKNAGRKNATNTKQENLWYTCTIHNQRKIHV